MSDSQRKKAAMQESKKYLKMEIDQVKLAQGNMSEYDKEQFYNSNRMIDAICKFLRSGQCSDVTIVCGTSSYKAHRAVICPKSKFFEAACKNGFKVSTAITVLPDTMTNPLEGRKHRSH